MAKINNMIKKELEEEFVPKFQELNKAMGIAPAGGSGGNPPKSKVPPGMPPTPKAPGPKKPSVQRPAATSTPKAPMASGQKATGKPKIPMGDGMKKEAPKESGKEDRYHIYQNGARLTEPHETVTLNDVNKKYGGVKSFESKGFKLIQDTPPKAGFKKNEEIAAEVMAGHKPRFLGDIKALAKTSLTVAMASLPFESLSKMGTQHVIAGEHVPTKAGPSPKSKKLKGNKDEGSGGQVTKEEISADKKNLEKQTATPTPAPTPPPPPPPNTGDSANSGLTGILRSISGGNPNRQKLYGKGEIPANKVIEPSDKKETLKKLNNCITKKKEKQGSKSC